MGGRQRCDLTNGRAPPRRCPTSSIPIPSLSAPPLSLPLVSPSPSREKLRRPIPASSGGIRRRPPHSREPPDPAPLRHLASARRCALPPHHFPSPLSPSLRSARTRCPVAMASSIPRPPAPSRRAKTSRSSSIVVFFALAGSDGRARQRSGVGRRCRHGLRGSGSPRASTPRHRPSRRLPPPTPRLASSTRCRRPSLLCPLSGCTPTSGTPM